MFNPYQFNQLSMFKNLINKKPQDVFSYLIQNNPQFKDFVDKNKDKTIEDIALDYDIDISMLKQFL